MIRYINESWRVIKQELEVPEQKIATTSDAVAQPQPQQQQLAENNTAKVTTTPKIKINPSKIPSKSYGLSHHNSSNSITLSRKLCPL